MTVAQIYDIINPITKEILGETAVVNEDLSNIVDIGTPGNSQSSQFLFCLPIKYSESYWTCYFC